MKTIFTVLLMTGLTITAHAAESADTQDSNQKLLPAGNLLEAPELAATVTPPQLDTLLAKTAAGKLIQKVAPRPRCTIQSYGIYYSTVSGTGTPTTASGAVMVPQGAAGPDPLCEGNRNVVLFAHGTTPAHQYNLAQLDDASGAAAHEAQMIAAFFASQGYIVIAPNYAGYHRSTLDYHPYLNARQQSTEMLNALSAGRAALADLARATKINAHPDKKLFVTGYSQGGHVAMATLRALQEQGIPVRAGATLSGPYGMSAFGDSIVGGKMAVGASEFIPLMITSYQAAYKNIYPAMKDIYAGVYASNPQNLLPSKEPVDQIYQSGKLPETALFQQAPTGNRELDLLSPPSPADAAAFASDKYLITTPFRERYLADQKSNPDGAVPVQTTLLPPKRPGNTLRQAFKLNDLRTYSPVMPVMLCAGHEDPTVLYRPNTQTMVELLSRRVGENGRLRFIAMDIDTRNLSPQQSAVVTYGLLPDILNRTVPFAAATQTSFQQTLGDTYNRAYQKALEQGSNQQQAATTATETVVGDYHATLVYPYCMANAKNFFDQY